MDKIWVVSKLERDEAGSLVFVIGVYDNECAAIARVSEMAIAVEERYEEKWGTKFEGQDHLNGYAKFEATDGYAETIITAIKFNVNEGNYLLID